MILDLGCGFHRWGDVGLDLDPIKEPDIIGDLHHLPIRDQSFDRGFCFEVLEHIHTPLEAVREIRRVIRGDALITVPNILSFWRFVRWMVRGRQSGSVEHISAWSPWEFKNLVERAGMILLETSFMTWPHFYHLSRFRGLIPRVFETSLVFKIGRGGS